MQLQSNAADPEWIYQEWLRKVDLRAKRLADADIPAEVRVDITFENVNADWRREIASIYRMLDLSFDGPLNSRMAKIVARSLKQGLDRHRYDVRNPRLD